MEFKGIIISLLEYKGNVSAVLFLNNCNLRCVYCYNPKLALGTEDAPTITAEETLKFLKERSNWLDAVTITGGEPTINPELPEFIKEVKKLGYKVQLETNGTNPEMIEQLIKDELVDLFSVDYKAPADEFEVITGVKLAKERLIKTVSLIISKANDYEFKITVIPSVLTEDKITRIGKELKGAKKIFIQRPRTLGCLNPEFMSKEKLSEEYYNECVEKMKPYADKVELR